MSAAPLVYLVGCNFTDPPNEQAWNDWYNGPKLAMMLRKPLFESCQRFEAVGLDTKVHYLAVWRVTNADAFTTPEYTSDWGFYEWADRIGDWTRDLCRLEGDDGPLALAVPADGALHFVRIECADPDEAQRARDEVTARCPDLTWGTAVGLDRSVPFVAVRVLAAGDHEQPQLDDLPVRQTLLRPLIEHTLSDD